MQRIVLGSNTLANYPMGGGHWTVFLQYCLGLKALGHQVLLLEVIRSTGNPDLDRHFIDSFFERMGEFGLKTNCALLLFPKDARDLSLDAAVVYGKTETDVLDFVQSSDFIWNFSGAIDAQLLTLFKKAVFVDLDPGHLQVSALDWDLGLESHDVFLTIGTKINDADCDVPRLGKDWKPFLPFVYLPFWQSTPDPGSNAPFGSVTQWTWYELRYQDRAISISKREAYLRYLDLPGRLNRCFELAINLHPEDSTGDRQLLERNGWRLAAAHDVACSPKAYRKYIESCRAEIVCPKPIFTELKTGWFSDRSACYLASGRPVLMEETGFGDHYPTGEGLLTFKNLDEAEKGVREIDANYQRHSETARQFAEEFLDSRKNLTRMIDLTNSTG